MLKTHRRKVVQVKVDNEIVAELHRLTPYPYKNVSEFVRQAIAEKLLREAMR